ncbi:hypothetical protein BFS30_15015 [Pedobacter steynii]|uniref:Uncharacterized protein n=1 Tax=Pedobacter steynii TaxID=430522 RepID=A0A1D7QI67_9SPHI|nr:hypothetical protein BFS30_15015 [Pedobacter steynii]
MTFLGLKMPQAMFKVFPLYKSLFTKVERDFWFKNFFNKLDHFGEARLCLLMSSVNEMLNRT